MQVVRFFAALLVSVLIHVVLAVGLGYCLSRMSCPDALAELDLSSVELSFADEESETAPTAPLPPSAPPQDAAPPAETRAPDPVHETLPPTPPLPGEVRLPDPKPPRDEMKTPPAPQHDPPAEPQAAPRQARIDAPPKPRRTIRPEYPAGARQRGEQGNVVLEIRVDADGAVETVTVAVSSGFEELDRAALRAARTARFVPARSDGATIASTVRLQLAFRLK